MQVAVMRARAIRFDEVAASNGHPNIKIARLEAELNALKKSHETLVKEKRAIEQFWCCKWEKAFGTPRGLGEIANIVSHVCSFYGVTLNDMLSERRTKDIALPRQVAMYICKTLTRKSLPQIGRFFGNRDHTTVLHALRKIEALVQDDSWLAVEINELFEIIRRGKDDETQTGP